MDAPSLPLRDVHLPPPPSWWPLAPGWWLLFAVAALLVGAWLFWRHRRQRRLREWQALFDRAQALPDPSARIAAVSELLRRAARRLDANAANLHGEAWLRFLDGVPAKGKPPRGFVGGAGRLLLEGGFRRDVGEAEAGALWPLARARFLELMAGKR